METDCCLDLSKLFFQGARFWRVPWTARRSKQSVLFIGRTDAEAEATILWPFDGKS